MSNYRFCDDVNIKDYYSFLEEVDKYNFSQLPEWAMVKDNWEHTLCGLYKDNKLVAGAMLLIKSLPLNLKMIYISRGPIMDFRNKEISKLFIDGLKDYAKRINAFCIKCDPFIIDESKDLSQDRPSKDIFKDYLSLMKEYGFIHSGFQKKIGTLAQPRYNMAISLKDENGLLTPESLMKKIPRKTRYYLGNYHFSKGIEFIKADEDDDLTKLVYFLKKTEERQGISLRNLDYFKKIKDAFKDRASVYYGRIHMDQYLDYLYNMLETSDKKEDYLKKIDEAKKIKEENGDIVYLCSSLVIYPLKNNKHKVAEYIYAGSDLSLLPTLRASTGMIYYACTDALNRECEYFNLGGVDGTFDDHLSDFKLKFDPFIWEFIGEFDLPVKTFIYFIYHNFYPILKKLI